MQVDVPNLHVIFYLAMTALVILLLLHRTKKLERSDVYRDVRMVNNLCLTILVPRR